MNVPAILFWAGILFLVAGFIEESIESFVHAHWPRARWVTGGGSTVGVIFCVFFWITAIVAKIVGA